MTLHTEDGGMQVRTDWSQLLDPPLATPASAARHTLLAAAGIVALAAACAVAIAMGLSVSVPFGG